MARLLASVGVLAGVLLLRDARDYAKRRSLGRVSERVVHTLRDRVYDSLLARPLARFRSTSSGELASTASNDIAAAQHGLTVVLTNLVPQVVVIAGHMATPDLIAFILYSEMITGPFVHLSTLVPEIARTRAAYARIAIARAFLKDPRILLLDEATSTLDRRSEASVTAALDALKRGRTTLVIAHRFDTIRTADRVLVVDDGRLVDAGTHADLERCCPLYRELSELSFVASAPTPADLRA